MGRRVVALVVLLLASALADSALADDGLILRRAVVRTGEFMTVWGSCGRKPIYLIPESFAKREGLAYRSLPAARPPSGPPFRFLGRATCTGQTHYIGDFPDGDWSAWSALLRFRVPALRPGVYRFVVYCERCRNGPGGTLIVNNWLWRGSLRVGETTLTILP